MESEYTLKEFAQRFLVLPKEEAMEDRGSDGKYLWPDLHRRLFNFTNQGWKNWYYLQIQDDGVGDKLVESVVKFFRMFEGISTEVGYSAEKAAADFLTGKDDNRTRYETKAGSLIYVMSSEDGFLPCRIKRSESGCSISIDCFGSAYDYPFEYDLDVVMQSMGLTPAGSWDNFDRLPAEERLSILNAAFLDGMTSENMWIVEPECLEVMTDTNMDLAGCCKGDICGSPSIPAWFFDYFPILIPWSEDTYVVVAYWSGDDNDLCCSRPGVQVNTANVHQLGATKVYYTNGIEDPFGPNESWVDTAEVAESNLDDFQVTLQEIYENYPDLRYLVQAPTPKPKGLEATKKNKIIAR